jgi:hypothetical protein
MNKFLEELERTPSETREVISGILETGELPSKFLRKFARLEITEVLEV